VFPCKTTTIVHRGASDNERGLTDTIENENGISEFRYTLNQTMFTDSEWSNNTFILLHRGFDTFHSLCPLSYSIQGVGVENITVFQRNNEELTMLILFDSVFPTYSEFVVTATNSEGVTGTSPTFKVTMNPCGNEVLKVNVAENQALTVSMDDGAEPMVLNFTQYFESSRAACSFENYYL
jgi:hypothetical protein